VHVVVYVAALSSRSGYTLPHAARRRIRLAPTQPTKKSPKKSPKNKPQKTSSNKQAPRNKPKQRARKKQAQRSKLEATNLPNKPERSSPTTRPPARLHYRGVQTTPPSSVVGRRQRTLRLAGTFQARGGRHSAAPSPLPAAPTARQATPRTAARPPAAPPAPPPPPPASPGPPPRPRPRPAGEPMHVRRLTPMHVRRLTTGSRRGAGCRMSLRGAHVQWSCRQDGGGVCGPGDGQGAGG
jgi:hypothetical protein